MKYFSTVSLLVILFFVSTYGQTEVWRMDGYDGRERPRPPAVGDGLGNLYLAHGGGVTRDTIKKIDATGAVAWQQEVDVVTGLYYGAGGLYALFTSGSPDSITYYDSLGTREWSYPLSGLPTYRPTGAVDNNGDLFVLRTAPTASLLKLLSNGTLAFEVPLPSASVINVADELYNNPVVDVEGNVWIDHHVRTYVERQWSLSYRAIGMGHIFVYRFKGTDGSLLMQELVSSEAQYRQDDNGRGRTRFYERDWPYLTNVVAANNMLVLAGTSHVYNIISSYRTTEDNLSVWRILVVQKNGKKDNFYSRGPGIHRVRSPGYQLRSDEAKNVLWSIVPGEGEHVYVCGSVARGRAIHDTGTVHSDGMIMRFNPASMDSQWTRMVVDEPARSLFVDPLSRIVVQFGASSIRMYDPSGNVGSMVFTFADQFVRMRQESNKEGGALVAFMQDDVLATRYVAKYTLPDVGFVPAASGVLGIQRSGYQLDQNYPNPFNPITSVAFHLDRTSFVTLKVYNVLGQEVAALLNREEMEEGEQNVEFDASKLASGVYFYRLVAESIGDDEEGIAGQGFVSVKKMLLVK